MAFGTGHHETTYMMIEMMSEINFAQKSVLDFGCGTGVLSILAKQLGAKYILALDHEQPAIDNTLENIQLNGLRDIDAKLGSLNIIPEGRKFDVILANVNARVLARYADQITRCASSDAVLLMSGILFEQVRVLKDLYAALMWQILRTKTKGEWTALKFSG